MSRCISTLHHTDPNRPDDQIIAMCGTSWRDSKKKGGIELTFMAAVHSIQSEGGRLATFYLLNTSLNRNKWKVTEEALVAALPSLLGKPLGCIPGYRVNHVHKPLEVGKWVKVDGRGGYALATAEITDDMAWEKLNSGEWGPISVVISAYRVTCSKCGEDITEEPCEHIKDGSGHEVIESFKFDRVDFVGTPAYPQAGIITLDELAEAHAARARMASYVQRSQSNGQAPGSLGENPNPEELREKQRMNEIAELKQEFETLKTTVETLKAGLEKPADDATTDDATENPELKQVQAELKAIKDERHAERVAAALDARSKAGLVKDQKKETEKLGKLDDATLILLAEDAARVAEKLAKAKTTTPKAQFTPDEAADFEAAAEAKRRSLGMPPRTLEAD